MSGIFEHNRLIKAEEVAEVLGTKPATIMKWVYEKKIPFVKFGPGKRSIVMFNPKRLNQWIEEELSHEPESDNGKSKKGKNSKKSSQRALKQFNDAVSNV